MRRWFVFLTLLLFAAPSAGASAQGSKDVKDAPTAHAVMVRMLDRNPTLSSYRSRVHVDVRMLNFPFLSPKLDGTTYFKRPGNFEVVFDRVPSYAKGFEKMFNDVGDPSAWEKDNNIVIDGTRTLYGRPYTVLKLTKKIYSTILDYALAYVDPASAELIQMEWHYRSGGNIVLRQWYRSEGTYSVISTQHAEINIPHVHAVADSQYGVYQTNVAVDDSVFTKK